VQSRAVRGRGNGQAIALILFACHGPKLIYWDGRGRLRGGQRFSARNKDGKAGDNCKMKSVWEFRFHGLEHLFAW
jgi:hypothetical protein